MRATPKRNKIYHHVWPYQEKPEAPKLSGNTSYLLLEIVYKFKKNSKNKKKKQQCEYKNIWKKGSFKIR